jgi:hypothetical protein
MLQNHLNSRLSSLGSAERPLDWLVCLETFCPRRYRASLPSRLRPSLFGSD